MFTNGKRSPWETSKTGNDLICRLTEIQQPSKLAPLITIPLIAPVLHMVRTGTRIISIQHQHANVQTRGSPIFICEKNGKYMKPQDARVESIWVSVAWISSTIYLPKAHCLLRSEHLQISLVCIELQSSLCIMTHRAFHIRYSYCAIMWSTSGQHTDRSSDQCP